LHKLGSERLVAGSTAAFATVLLILAWLPSYARWCAVLPAAGAAWLAALTHLNAAAIAVIPA
jgi:hypothetical protein